MPAVLEHEQGPVSGVDIERAAAILARAGLSTMRSHERVWADLGHGIEIEVHAQFGASLVRPETPERLSPDTAMDQVASLVRGAEMCRRIAAEAAPSASPGPPGGLNPFVRAFVEAAVRSIDPDLELRWDDKPCSVASCPQCGGSVYLHPAGNDGARGALIAGRAVRAEASKATLGPDIVPSEVASRRARRGL